MSLHDYCIPPRRDDESLSSWAFRLREGIRLYPAGDASKLTDKVLTEVIKDMDDILDNETLYVLVNCIDPKTAEAIIAQCNRGAMWRKMRLDGAAQVDSEGYKSHSVVIPYMYRASYCYECMVEGICETELPVAKESWRYVLEPFCAKHRCLLYDTHQRLSQVYDFPVQVFRQHWYQAGNNARYVEANRMDAARLTLALETQVRIRAFLDESMPEQHRQNGLGFILTLFRMLLCSNPPWVYGGSEFPTRRVTETHGNYCRFYREPLRATARSRAKALFGVGLLLGWISEEAAKSADCSDDYAPTEPFHIWANLSLHPWLDHWVRRELSLYQCELFSIDMLKGFHKCQ